MTPLAPNSDPSKKVSDLTRPAERTLTDLLHVDKLRTGQWLMRLSLEGDACDWKPLAADTATNDRLIKERIAHSTVPITELAVGYVGMIDWRGSKRLMAYLQYFKAEYELGVLCLRHVKEASRPGTFEGFGGFFVAGACKNIWI